MRLALLALAAVLALSGCAKPGSDYTSFNQARRLGVLYINAPHFPDEAVVVLGIAPGADRSAAVQIEQKTGPGADSLDKKLWTAGANCAKGALVECDATGAQFAIFRMPPGTYGVVSVGISGRQYTLAGYDRLFRKMYQDRWGKMTPVGVRLVGTHLQDDTPRFTVKAGETVYVGTLAMSMGEAADSFVTSLRVDEAGARTALAEEGFSQPLAVRPWDRPAGPGPRPHRQVQ